MMLRFCVSIFELIGFFFNFKMVVIVLYIMVLYFRMLRGKEVGGWFMFFI